MKLSKSVVILCLSICLLIGATPVQATEKAVAQETIFARLWTAVTSVLDAVSVLNRTIDTITDVQVRRQLRRNMYRLHRQMEELERKKQNLRESVSAAEFISDNVNTDIDEMRQDIQGIRQSLINLSAILRSQSGFDGNKFADLMNQDLNDKMADLIIARRESDKTKLLQRLDAAIGKIREARQAVGQCLQHLNN